MIPVYILVGTISEAEKFPIKRVMIRVPDQSKKPLSENSHYKVEKTNTVVLTLTKNM